MTRSVRYFCALAPDMTTKGNARLWAEMLEQECDIPNLFEHIPPHITLVPPFLVSTKDKQLAVRSAIAEITSGILPFFLNIDGPHLFKKPVESQPLYYAVHVVERDERLIAFAGRLRDRISQIIGAPIEAHPDGYKPHVSIARGLSDEQAERARQIIGLSRDYFPGRRSDLVILYRRVMGKKARYVVDDCFSLLGPRPVR